MSTNCQLEIIKWSKYQTGIAPLWGVEPDSIPIVNNPYHMMEYGVDELLTDSLFYPVRLMVDGEVVAHTGIQTISPVHTRIRGILVEPQHRGKGYGYRILDMASRIFPECFGRTFGYYRENRVAQFEQHGDLTVVPDLDWFWSEHSRVNMRLMYREWGPGDEGQCREFTHLNHATYGLCGTNNLNWDVSPKDWSDYATPHYEVYPRHEINLRF